MSVWWPVSEQVSHLWADPPGVPIHVCMTQFLDLAWHVSVYPGVLPPKCEGMGMLACVWTRVGV